MKNEFQIVVPKINSYCKFKNEVRFSSIDRSNSEPGTIYLWLFTGSAILPLPHTSLRLTDPRPAIGSVSSRESLAGKMRLPSRFKTPNELRSTRPSNSRFNRRQTKWWNNVRSFIHHNFLFLVTLSLIGLLLSGCRKEIEFEDDFDEVLYYLNGVLGVGESPKFTMGEVTSAADTFHIDFSCDAAISLISAESNTLNPIRTEDGLCNYMKPNLSIAPLTNYTVQANIDGRVLTSEIETPQVHPYNFSLVDVNYLGESIGTIFVNGEIIRFTANLYQVSFEALYSGEGVPGPYAGVSLEFGSDSVLIIDSDVIGRETMRPGTFQKIEELVIDDRENGKLEVVMEIKVPERLDSVTLIPMVWSLDKHINQYILSYDTHEGSVSDPFAVPARMYSNIQGGVGIFGSYSRSADTMRVKLPE